MFMIFKKSKFVIKYHAEKNNRNADVIYVTAKNTSKERYWIAPKGMWQVHFHTTSRNHFLNLN